MKASTALWMPHSHERLDSPSKPVTPPGHGRLLWQIVPIRQDLSPAATSLKRSTEPPRGGSQLINCDEISLSPEEQISVQAHPNE